MLPALITMLTASIDIWEVTLDARVRLEIWGLRISETRLSNIWGDKRLGFGLAIIAALMPFDVTILSIIILQGSRHVQVL